MGGTAGDVGVLAALWHTLRYFDAVRLAPGLGAVVWAVVGFTANGRLLPLVALVTVLTVGLAAVQRRWRTGALLAITAAATMGLSTLFAGWVQAAVWDDPGDANTVGGVLSRLSDPRAVVESAIGQIWYQLAATAMIFGVGVIVVVRASVRQGPTSPRRVDAGLLLVFTLPLIAMSIVFMSDRTRTDQLIYGRYNDSIMWPLLAVAIGWLATDLGASHDGFRHGRW